jgi:type IV fimbrial biogenesis protein FimT
MKHPFPFSVLFPANRTSFRAPPRAGAFSLHDALVSLAVAGTLAASGVPALAALIASQRLTTASNDLLAALNSARSEAIKRGVHVALCPSSDGSRCNTTSGKYSLWQQGYLLYADHNINHERDAEEPVLRRFEAIPGFSIRSSRYRDSVSYLPNGLANGSNLTILLCPEGGRGPVRAVIVSNTGRARITSTIAVSSALNCADTS